MTSNTQVVTAGNSFTITRSMNVQQFSVVGLSSTTVWSYEGTGPATQSNGSALTPMPISFSGTVSYNSKQAASANNPWDGIVISVTTGSVGIELLLN